MRYFMATALVAGVLALAPQAARAAEVTEGKMALFISHRFSTVRMADRIVVLEDGRIAEDGSHEVLTRMGGRYAEMFEMQAASYR